MTEAELPRESHIRDHDAGLYTRTRIAETVEDISDVNGEACRFFETNGYLAVARACPVEMVVAARSAGRRPDRRTALPISGASSSRPASATRTG